MKKNSLQKKPKSAEEYANFFLLDENGEKRDFSNVNSVCFITIGYAETLWILLQEFAGKDITIIDRKSELDFIEAVIKIHKRDDVKIARGFEVEKDEDVLNTILLNMNFDLIVVNPPYGKSSSLSKKIVNKMLECKVAEEIIYLSPRNTYKDSKILAHVASYQDTKNCFADAAIDRLAITRIVSEVVNKYTYENISLNKKQVELLSAIRNYNSQHDAYFHVVDGNCFSKKWDLQLKDTNSQIQLSVNLKGIADKKLADLVENFQCFFKTIWTPLDGVHITDSHDIRYNLNNVFDEKVKEGWFKGRGGDLFVFKDRISRENFNKWWYSCKELYGKERKGLTNYILGMLCEAVSTSAGVNSFYDYLPHVDWSKSWDDKEILAEIGLPGDFLEEE